MSKGKGFGKFILFCATVGAAAAGVYYYLNKRDAEIADSFDDDDFEEFEDFDEDFDDTNETRFGSRKYVDIKPVEEKTAATAEDTAFEDGEEGLEDTAFDEEAEKTSEAKEADKAEAKDSEIATPDASEEFFDDEKEEK